MTASYTHSQNKFTDTAEGGYASLIKFNDLVNSGTWDPLMAVAGSSVDLVAPIVLHEQLDASKSSIDVLSAHGSTTIGKLEGGDIGLAVGVDMMKQKYSDSPSAILQGANPQQPNFADAIVGGGGGALPFDSSRNSYGLFTEIDAPVSKTVDISASARYDSFAAVKNALSYDQNGTLLGSATQGKKNSSGTFKLSARLQPTKDFLLRGSIGTGFRAPTLSNITKPLSAAGSTGFHTCPFLPGDPQYAWCDTATSGGPNSQAQEFNIQSGGNPASDASGLKPEHSVQWTIGTRIEPAPSLSLGLDLWTVRLKDQIGSITEDTAFFNGANHDQRTQYPQLFAFVPDPISGKNTLTFLSVPINTGRAYYQGIDFDGTARNATPLGRLTTNVHATYMLRADYQQPGRDGYFNSLNHIGVDGTNTFQWLLSVSTSLESGAFTHTLTANFKPGYNDDWTDYCRTDASGNCLLLNVRPDGTPGDPMSRYVGSYNVFDWQTKYDFSKEFAMTVGLKNMFDTKPPFSIIDQAGTGNARGFDGRYTDPTGRQFYLTATYKF